MEQDRTAYGAHRCAADREGRREAALLRESLAGRRFVRVLTSPLSRAVDTCRLAGLGQRAEATEALLEWDYGDYEGMTTPAIRERRPGWVLWRDGCPNGETAAQVAARVDPLIAELRGLDGDAALFAHGHVLRVLGARWVGLGPEGRLAAGALHRDHLPARLGARDRSDQTLERRAEGLGAAPGVPPAMPRAPLRRARRATAKGVVLTP